MIRFIYLIPVVILALSCTQKTKTPEAPIAKTWNEQMQELSQVLADLYPDLVSSKKFNDPKNQKRINANVSRLKNLSHTLNPQTKRIDKVSPPDPDPTLRLLSRRFDQDMARASEALNEGHNEYARSLLRNATSYCIECHTRNDMGPEFPRLQLGFNEGVLSPAEKAEFYISTRQYDLALKTYDEILSNSSTVEAYPFQWERSARQALTLAIRVKQDPKLALEIAEKIQKSPRIASFFHEQVTQWIKDLKSWQHEKTKKTPSIQYARQLIQKAERYKSYPMDGRFDMLYLRASTALHDYLASARSPSSTSEALYLLGLCHEAERDGDLWDLNETFYQACIRENPHSDQAVRCYRKLEENIYLGYSGSQGLAVPSQARKELTQWQELATPITK